MHVKIIFLLCAEFNPEEVGSEGQGYIWRPEAGSDDEMEQIQDVWGEKKIDNMQINTPSRERKPISANPGLKVNREFNFFYIKVF